MAMFIFGIILVVIAIVAAIVAIAVRDARPPAAVTGVIALLLGLLFIILPCFTIVSTRQFGVGVAFGKPTEHYTNGLHTKAPWVKVHEVDGTVQTDTYASDTFNGPPQDETADGGCVNVRIARQGTACVNVSFRWQNKESGVDYLYRNFRGHDAVKDKLVKRDLQTALNEVFGDYDPLNIDPNGNSKNLPLNAPRGQTSLSQQVLSEMRTDIGQWIDVQNVLIPIIHFDGDTQARLNQVQQQVAKTRVAVQQQATAQQQAIANDKIAASINKDPNVLTYQCLLITQDAVDKGKQLPAGWNCNGSQVQGSIPLR